jgi:AcrR family transcriptional regulator
MSVRDQLIEAAARLYAEAGYRGATTRRIAVEAGVNEITLFRHFGSKDALIREAISRAESSLVSNVMLPETPKEPFREVKEWARAHIAELRERRSLIRTCMGEIEEHPGIISAENSPPALAAKDLCRYLGRLRETGLAKAPFDEVAASTMLMGCSSPTRWVATSCQICTGMSQNKPWTSTCDSFSARSASDGVGA